MNLTEIERRLSDGSLSEHARPRDESFESIATAVLASVRLGMFPEAEELAARLRPSTPDEEATSLVLAALLRQMEGQHRKAMEILDESAPPENASPDALAPLLLLRAELLQLLGRDAESLEAFAAALQVAEKADMPEVVLPAVEGMSLALRSMRDEARAERTAEHLLDCARSVAENPPSPFLLARAAEQIALIASPEEAAPLFERALDEAGKRGLMWDEANVRLARGRFEEFSCRFEEALEHTAAAVSLFEEMNARPALLEAMEQLASQLANQARYEEALAVLERMRKLAESISDLHFLFSSLVQSAWLAWEGGDVRRALDTTAELLARCAEHDARPAAAVELVREAFMRAPRELIREKLGDFVSSGEDFGL